VVVGIASQEQAGTVRSYVEQLGLSYPILLDSDGSVNRAYAQVMAFPTAAYPQDWVISTEGVVVYANNRFELAELTAAVEGQLD
jgi:peroxiredoxin